MHRNVARACDCLEDECDRHLERVLLRARPRNPMAS
jgi:hypothetical protein